MKKKEFQKPSIKLVKMEQNISILAGSEGSDGIMTINVGAANAAYYSAPAAHVLDR